MKYFTASIKMIRRSPYVWAAIMLLLSLTFFVANSFALFLAGSHAILNYFETRPQLTAFLKLNTTQDDVQRVADAAKQLPGVISVNITSKEQALALYREDIKNQPLLLSLVTAEMLPSSIEVSTQRIDALPFVKETLEGNAAVGEVLYQADLAQSLQDWTRSIRYAGWISIITLSCTSLLAVMVTTGMNVAAHRKSISVMRLIGATQWFVKAPYVYAGMYIGVIGAVAGYGLCLAGLYVIEPWLISFLRGIISFPLPWQFFAAQAGVSVVVGAVLGALASSAAVDRMLRHA